MDLPAWRGCFGDSAKLRSVHEPIRCTQVRMVKRIKGLSAQLDLDVLGHPKLKLQGKVKGLLPGTINSVSSHITEGERRRRGKCRGVKPIIGRVCAGPEYRLARIVGADWVFAQQRAGVCGIAEHRDGEGKPALRLIDC